MFSSGRGRLLRPFTRRRAWPVLFVVALAVFGYPQSSAAQSAQAEPDPAEDPPLRFVVPDVTVTAQKEPEDRQRIPVSVTAVPLDTITQAGIRIVSDAAMLAPNTFFTEFTARQLTSARFRGIGSSPNNPAVTTYIDGVPQIHGNAANVELLAVDQIELVRGPQGALFGRNTLGGLINVTTRRPARDAWSGTVSVPFGNHGAWAARGDASGPLVADRLSAGVSFAQVVRDGFTVNDVTGHRLDARSAFSGKGQLLWTPTPDWEARVIVTGERARDGDYGLHDLAGLRANPFHAARDFEGHVQRDLVSTTIHARRAGEATTFSAITGVVRWTTQDVTDLDYTPRALVVRDNTERDVQFTQELRLASAEDRAIPLGDAAAMRWQAGLFVFSRGYDQDAVNTFAPFLLSPLIDHPVDQQSPRSALDDAGVGLFTQATVTVRDRLDLTAGARLDYERTRARIETSFDPPIQPPAVVVAEDSFTDVSPQLAAAYRVGPEHRVYATVGRGFKAGGFNAAAPPGREAYGRERAWHVEAGLKSAWANGRVVANTAVFHIDWDDLQLNVPDPAVPAQFYIANVGGATSRGVEVEVRARPAAGVDLFSAVGYTRARFAHGSTSGGMAVGGNALPSTPDYTASAGVQYVRAVTPAATAYGRLDVVFYGAFRYDDANTEGQEAYSLTHLRGGLRWKHLFVEAWIRNAFDRRYVPVAFAYDSFAPSGFIGEMGAPRTFGAGAGVRF